MKLTSAHYSIGGSTVQTKHVDSKIVARRTWLMQPVPLRFNSTARFSLPRAKARQRRSQVWQRSIVVYTPLNKSRAKQAVASKTIPLEELTDE